MRTLLLLFLIWPFGSSLDDTVALAKQHSVLVQGISSQGMGNQGTGIILKTGIVVTSYHLLADEVWVDGVPATILRVDLANDLVLLSVATAKVEALEYDFRPVETQTVVAVGNPLNNLQVVTIGRIVKLNQDWIATDTITQPGFSGSGVYSLKGKLLAMMARMQGAPYGNWISWSISAQKIQAFAESK